MSYKPRSILSTHTVSNQPPLDGQFNLWADPALRNAVTENLGQFGIKQDDKSWIKAHKHLTSFANLVGSRKYRELGRLANENKPVLRQFDARGRRIDEVEYHPAYHELLKTGLENGLSARAWGPKPASQTLHAALGYMMGWAGSGVCCPLTMTYAVTPVLAQEEWTTSIWKKGVLSEKYDRRSRPAKEKTGLTMGMAMTEKQGGSDLRANSTQAKVSANGEAELIGHKWFCSAPMSDGFLTLAYEDVGLSCFLVPRWRPDGTRNAFEIQRLKDKMGDRSNASSEIEYRKAWARRVGPAGRGIPTLITMAHHTRFDCITGSAAGQRKAVALAHHFVSHRTAFQKKLIDQPLMRTSLADLALESEAAIALAFLVARGFDSKPDTDAALLSRILTPIAKYWVCKRQPAVVAECLECLGGVGFVEESGMPILFRTSPLNSIWEGSGNVIVLDIARALNTPQTSAVFKRAVLDIAEEIPALLPMANWLIDTMAHAGNSRKFAELSAIFFATSALPEGPIRQSWIKLRVQNPSHIWGGSSVKLDEDILLNRLAGWHIPKS